MRTLIIRIACLTIITLLSTSIPAQPLSYTGGALTENFDSMGAAGTTTPSGWVVGWHNGATTVGTMVRTNGATINTGNTAADGAIAGFNCGTNDATGGLDRSLGTSPTGGNSPNGPNRFLEVQIRNDSGQSLNGIAVRYTGKQWRTAQNAGQNFTNYLQYSSDGFNYRSMGAAFDFRAPVTTPANIPINGNLPANYITNLGGIYTPPLPVSPGNTIYLRWLDLNDPGTDPVLAMDSFSFSAAALTPVAITAQPQGQMVPTGESATLSVTATGFPLFYQWFKNGAPVLTATNSVWRYNQSGLDFGKEWKETSFDDSA